jgi:hypothetical protein
MSPEEQEKYGDWTPAQLHVFQSLIENESPDDDVWA